MHLLFLALWEKESQVQCFDWRHLLAHSSRSSPATASAPPCSLNPCSATKASAYFRQPRSSSPLEQST